MPNEEYLELVRQQIGDDDFARYLEIRRRLSECRETARGLEAELETLVAAWGLPGRHTAGDTSPVLHPPRVNNWWVKTRPDWRCPCCRRTKPQILRPDRSGRLFGDLVAHHDHFRDLLDNIEVQRAKAVGVSSVLDTSSNRFVRRFDSGLVRFDDAVICADCNSADTRAKKIVGAPAHFTFTPQEIAGFIDVEPNRVHGIKELRAKATYATARPHFDRRVRLAERLADLVLQGGHWLQETEWSDRPDTIDRDVESVMQMFGFDEAARWAVAEQLLRTKTERKTAHSTWRTRTRKAAPPPSQREVDYIVRSQAQRWNRVPEDWCCPCCNRSKREVIRPTNQFDWMFVLDEARFVADIDAATDTIKVLICDACRQTLQDFNQDARNDPQIESMDGPYLSVTDLRRIVRPQAHGLHNVNSGEVDRLLSNLRQMSRADASEEID